MEAINVNAFQDLKDAIASEVYVRILIDPFYWLSRGQRTRTNESNMKPTE